jgi:hypothetical protein
MCWSSPVASAFRGLEFVIYRVEQSADADVRSQGDFFRLQTFATMRKFIARQSTSESLETIRFARKQEGRF